jgi:hypothetical protein
LCVKSAKTLKPIFNKLTKLGFWGFAWTSNQSTKSPQQWGLFNALMNIGLIDI